jgi:flagellar hook-associated protein 2
MKINGLNGRTMSVSFVGLNSNLDSAGLIRQLVELETQARVQPLELKRREYVQERSELNSLKSNLTSLQDSLEIDDITDGVEKLVATSASVSDSTVASATITAKAQPQSFELSVNQLATQTKVSSSNYIDTGLTTASDISEANLKGESSITDGTVTINDETFSLSGLTTVQSMLDFINNNFTGVSASLVDGHVELSGVTKIGSSGDTSNLITALGLDNAPIVAGDLKGVQNIATPDTEVLLTDLGITGTNIQINGEDVTFDPNVDTLDALIRRINTSSGTKVSASYDSLNGRLALRNKETGALTITLGSTDSNLLTQLDLNNEELGNNAEFSISTLNGGDTLVSNSNKVFGLIEGLTLELTETTDTTPITVEITEDPGSYKNRIDSVINNVNSILTDLSRNNTSTNRRLANGIKGILTKAFDNSNSQSYNASVSVGLKSNLVNDRFSGYTIDSSVFNEALANDPASIDTLFYGKADSEIPPFDDGSSGIFVQLEEYLKTYTRSKNDNGILDNVIDNLDQQIRSKEDDIVTAEDRVFAFEQRLVRQYNELDRVNADLQSQQAALNSSGLV